MPTLIVIHEVDDVDLWLSSSKREEVFKPYGITGRIFRDSAGSNRVGVIVESPDMAVFNEFIQSDETAKAMKYDGVRPDTVLLLTEGSDIPAWTGVRW
jgi:hypothetical protein